jgi:hypothetical protein
LPAAAAIIALTAVWWERGAADIDVVDPLPGVVGVLVSVEEDLARTPSDGVDDDVEPAEPFDGLAHDLVGC